MTFYCLNRKDKNQTTITSLEGACRAAKISFRVITVDSFNHTKDYGIKEKDFLYSLCSADSRGPLIEKVLLQKSGCRNFYKNSLRKSVMYDNVFEASLIHDTAQLPIIPSIYDFTRDRSTLKDYAHSLGGFPLVLKMLGGSHGVGVVRVDSEESLYSVVDLLVSRGEKFIIRKYINTLAHYRCIVLSGAMIASAEYKKVEGDFRTNVGKELDVQCVSVDEEIADVAIKAVDSLGLSFGGVDILVDQEKNIFIAEVNFPCFYPRVEKACDIDISARIVEFAKTVR